MTNISNEQAILIANQMALNTKPILGFSEACSYLGISNSMLYKLTSTRSIPFSKPNGKVIYFYRADLEKWAMGNIVHSTEQINAEANRLAKKGGKRC